MTAPHEPTDEMREKVSEFTSFGITQEEIAEHFKIDLKTLRKHYRDELDNAQRDANAKVARVLFEKCVVDKDTASVFFWLKTRAKWRETDKKDDKSTGQALLETLQEAMKDSQNGQTPSGSVAEPT